MICEGKSTQGLFKYAQCPGTCRVASGRKIKVYRYPPKEYWCFELLGSCWFVNSTVSFRNAVVVLKRR